MMWDCVSGRKVLVIGNGSDRSSRCDTDFIIRMNDGIVEGRTDLWVDGISYIRPIIGRYQMPKYIWRLSKKGIKAPSPYEVGRLSNKDMEEMKRSLGLGNPSTGIRLLWCLINKATPQEIHVTGFNGNHNHLTNRENSGVHSWEEEREILGEWSNSSLLHICQCYTDHQSS